VLDYSPTGTPWSPTWPACGAERRRRGRQRLRRLGKIIGSRSGFTAGPTASSSTAAGAAAVIVGTTAAKVNGGGGDDILLGGANATS